MDLSLTLNHHPWCGPLTDPSLTLLQFLRREGLTGAKEGCAEGDCGACSVVLLDHDGHGEPVWRSINSCLVPVITLQGRSLVTAEGIGCPAKLHPVQQSMIHHHGSQCGYCTPGFICSLYEGWHRTDLVTQAQPTDQLAGNLCRCTGYRAIHDAACEALQNRPTPVPPAGPVTFATPPPAALDKPLLHRPATPAALLQLRADQPDLRLVAGSTEVGLEITKKFRSFPALLSPDAVPELHVIQRHPAYWEIGAAVTLTNIGDAIGPDFPSLAKMLWLFGSRPIRNRATLGGNLATASPIGDSAPVLLALRASVVLASIRGTRTVPLDEFFTGYRQTVLQPDEIITTILLPLPAPSPGIRHEQCYKVSRRLEMDISTVSGSFVVLTDSNGLITHARLAFGGVAATPALAPKTAAWLIGQPWSAGTFQTASEIAITEFSPLSDVRGSATYRRALIAGMVQRFPTYPPGPAPPILSPPSPRSIRAPTLTKAPTSTSPAPLVIPMTARRPTGNSPLGLSPPRTPMPASSGGTPLPPAPSPVSIPSSSPRTSPDGMTLGPSGMMRFSSPIT